MTSDFDLDAYLGRIHWTGGTQPTFETLAGLLQAHTARIPFENLDVLLGRPVRLDIESLQNKLVRARRGGYCFEHATLFATALEHLGFQPVRHSARVTLFVPRTEAPRTHMFLTVPLPEGTFVVDPGFGPFGARVPLPLAEDAPAENATHWMVREGNLWILQAPRNETIGNAWVSTLEPDNPVDFEMGNHFTATHPASPFVSWLMLSALTADGRVTVMNRDLTIRRAGQAQSSQIADRAALRALLNEHFGFDLPEVEQMRIPSIPEWD